MNNASVYKGMLLALAGFFSFTLSDTVTKDLSASFGAMQISFMSSLISLIAVFIFSSKLGGIKKTFITPQWKILWARGLAVGLAGISAVIAFGLLPFVKAYTLIFVAPFFSIFMGMLVFKDKVEWRRWCAILAGFSGVIIALRPGIITFEAGAFLAMSCGTLIALSWVLIRHLGEGQTTMSFAAYPAICGLVITAYPALSNFIMPTDILQIAIIVGGAFAALSGLLLVSHAFRIAPAAVVSPVHYSQLIFGVVLGYLFFNEIPDMWTIIGSCVIIVSGLYLVYREWQIKGAATLLEQDG